MLSNAILADFLDKTLPSPFSFLYLWQLPVIVLLIAIIIFWVMYRRKQM